MCLQTYGNFLTAKDPLRARELATEAVEIAHRLGERWVMQQALSAVALVDLDSGELSEARQVLEQGAALALELNDVFNVSTKLVRLAQLEMDECRFARALDLYARCVSNYRLIGNRLRLALVLHDAGVAARLEGAADRALPAFEESLALYLSFGQVGGVAAVRASLGHLYLQQEAIPEAAAEIKQSLEELRRDGTGVSR